MSFFSTVVPVIMRQESYSLESIGLLQLVKLPWIFKFLWAPLVDNKAQTGAQLRRWIVFSELFYAVVILSIAFFNLQTHFLTIIILMVIAFIASATQDIATDAFAIMVLKKKERSLGNSIQSAGSFVGSLFGTGVLLIAYYYFGWQALLVLLAIFVLIALIPITLFKYEKARVESTVKRAEFLDIFRFFNSKKMFKRVFILLFYYSGIIGILAMLKPYLVDLGYTTKEIGIMSGIVGTSVAACCAFLAGAVIKRIGRKTSMYAFLMLSFLAGGYMWYISQGIPNLWQLYIGICLIWGSYGFSTVIIYTTSMDVVREGREGTDFTVQIVLTHLSSIIIAIASGRLGDRLGYTNMFGLEALLSAFTFIILIFALYKVRFDED